MNKQDLYFSRRSDFVLAALIVSSILFLNWLYLPPASPREASLSTSRREVTGIGLRGEYFNNSDLTDHIITRIDPNINFNWGNKSPGWPIGRDNFSVRWTGQIKPRFSEAYTFYTFENDGVRLWINDELIINSWTDHPYTAKSRGSINLIGGAKYKIKAEYFESTGRAAIRLLWSSPSQSAEIVPQSSFYPSWPEQQVYLRPINDSPEQEWDCYNNYLGSTANNYPNVNEELADDALSFCRKYISSIFNSGKRNIYKLTKVANLGTINDISVIARGRKDNINDFPVNLKIGIRDPSKSLLEFDGDKEFAVDNAWRDYEVSFGPTNPITGKVWTEEDINNLEIFHKLGSIPSLFGEKLVVTQIYARITYTPNTQIIN